jgi:N6-adenosine-specific RNA methylase IME4
MKHAAEAAQEKNRLSISTPEERAAKSGPGLYDQAERKAEEKKASVKTGKLHALLGQLEREHALINGWSQKVMIEGRLKPATMIEAMTVLPDAEVSAAVMSDDQFEVRVCFVDVILKKRLCWFIAEPPLPALQPFPATGVFPAPKTPAEKASYRETVDTNREAKHAAIAGEAKDLASPDKLGPFSVLYVDPPWQYSARVSESKSIEQQYPTLSIAELCALNVPSITAPRAVLYLWVTAPMIKEALQLLDAWGFVYKSQAVWIKGRNGAGMGHYWRVDHELLFVATKGNFGPSDPEVRVSSVLEYPRGRHSEKPRDVREYLDSLYSRDEHPRVELFARETAEGWVSIGNEIDGRDIREVLNPTKQMGLPRAATPKESATDTTLLSGALPQTEATKRGRCHFCELLNDCTLLGGKKLICAGCRTKDLRGRCAKCWTTKNDCRVIDDELQCASCQEVFSPKAKEEPQEETSSWPHWFCLICGFSCIKVEEWNTHCKDAHGRVASATPITINGNSCCVSSCVKGEVVPGSRLRDWLFFGASAVSFCTDKDKRWKGLQNSVDYHVGKGLIFKIDQYGDQYVGPKPTSKEAAAPDAVGPWANRALSQLRACTTREEFDQAYTKLEALASTLDERNELLSYREELRAKLPHESNVKPSAREAYVKSAEKNPEKAAELPPATGPELIHMQAWLVEHANLNSKGGYTLFEDEVRDVSLTPKQFASWQNDKRIKMRTPNWLEDMTADMKRCNTVGEGTRIFDAMIDLTVTTAERDKCRAVFSEWKHSKPATVPYNRTAPKPTRNKGKNEEKKVSKKAGRR